jgi:hypothetical protein
MPENEGVALRAIRWSEILPWLSLAKSFRLAVTLRLMTFGAIAVLLTLFGWWQIAGFFSRDGVTNRSWTKSFGDQSAWQVIDESVPGQPFSDLNLPWSSKSRGLGIQRWSPVLHSWAMLNEPVCCILRITLPSVAEPSSTTAPLSLRDFLSLLFSALWSLAVWAYFGAAISRVAAVQLATGEQVGWGAALRWARSKWLAYVSAAILPMLGVALIVLPILLLGILMKSDFFAFLAALIWPLVLIGGVVMALLLSGLLLGWPLMWATISVEGTDSFDALNRTYAYVFQKPARYLFYTVVAAVVGWLGWIVVVNFAAAVIWLASWAVTWGAGPGRMEDLATSAASSVIAFWAGWVKLLAIGYSFSYFGVASTAIYYLLRRDVDARETDEVFLDADSSEQRFGLPKIQKDAAGAPEISEKPASNIPHDAEGDV